MRAEIIIRIYIADVHVIGIANRRKTRSQSAMIALSYMSVYTGRCMNLVRTRRFPYEL